eukprot:9241928-Pyramimonas_sp.AAC.1
MCDRAEVARIHNDYDASKIDGHTEHPGPPGRAAQFRPRGTTPSTRRRRQILRRISRGACSRRLSCPPS